MSVSAANLITANLLSLAREKHNWFGFTDKNINSMENQRVCDPSIEVLSSVNPGQNKNELTTDEGASEYRYSGP